jgi:hypothetical protein
MLKKFLLLLLAISFAACQPHQLPDAHLESILARELIANNQLAVFDFCDKAKLNLDWDSLLVVKPYCSVTEIERLPISNSKQITDLVHRQAEGGCAVFFLKNGTCTTYSTIARSVVDFAELGLSKQSGFALITKHNCVKKFTTNPMKGGCT